MPRPSPFEAMTAKLAEVETELKHVGLVLGRLEGRLFGDGSEDNPGLIADVDRLKQTDKRRTYAICALVSGLIGMAANQVSSFFK